VIVRSWSIYLTENTPPRKGMNFAQKIMKIIYWGQIDPKLNSVSELDVNIETALKKLGKVISYDERTLLTMKPEELNKLITDANKSDFFIFRTGGVLTTNNLEFMFSLEGFGRLLQEMKCVKIFFFTDKVWGLSGTWMGQIIPKIDYGFINDDTWLRRQVIENVFPLHLGIGDKEPEKGEIKEELKGDIAFIGDVFGIREEFVSYLKKEYKRRFKVFEPKEGKEFADICASTKIIISPRFPSDDFYWEDRIYKTLAYSGFLVHPRLEGLKEEGFISGQHYISYKSREELKDIVDHFTDPKNEEERLRIIEQGKKFVRENFLYSKRMKDMFSKIKLEMAKKTK